MSTMPALTFDVSEEAWGDGTTGMRMREVAAPTLNPRAEADHVLIRVQYAGFCGTDRGIWSRASMGDMIVPSIEREQPKSYRIFGHELLGTIVEMGDDVADQFGYRLGDTVSTESHIVCDTCVQCVAGQKHVCSNEKIIGVSVDGCFGHFVKLPAKALWPTDTQRIRPEIGALQEPFGNAVHACQVADLSGKTVAILGTGTIGLFAVLVAKGMGASSVIGVDPQPTHLSQAQRLGCDAVFAPRPRAANDGQPWSSDADLCGAILDHTGGIGADVVLEMSGHPSSVNNALSAVRRGGDVVLFGLKNGAATIEDFHRIIMNGITLHGVVGRRIFDTWRATTSLLHDETNGIQQAIWDVILNQGDGPIVDVSKGAFDRHAFEHIMRTHTKPVLKFG